MWATQCNLPWLGMMRPNRPSIHDDLGMIYFFGALPHQESWNNICIFSDIVWYTINTSWTRGNLFGTQKHMGNILEMDLNYRHGKQTQGRVDRDEFEHGKTLEFRLKPRSLSARLKPCGTMNADSESYNLTLLIHILSFEKIMYSWWFNKKSTQNPSTIVKALSKTMATWMGIQDLRISQGSFSQQQHQHILPTWFDLPNIIKMARFDFQVSNMLKVLKQHGDSRLALGCVSSWGFFTQPRGDLR